MKWFKGDSEIKPKKKDKRISVDWDISQDIHILEIKLATQKDAGDYVVKAENDRGYVRATFNIVVVGKDESTEVSESAEVSLTTKAEKSEISESAQLRIESEITEEVTEAVDASSTVTLQAVTGTSVTEEGVAEVTIVKEEGGQAPEFVTFPQPSIVKEGETIRITCKIKGLHNYSLHLILMQLLCLCMLVSVLAEIRLYLVVDGKTIFTEYLFIVDLIFIFPAYNQMLEHCT